MNTHPAPWHVGKFERLAAQFESGRLPHALLIHGAPGIGKMLFLQALAALLLCQQVARGRACGSCRSCQLVNAGTHPDYLVLAPLEPGKPIIVDQARGLGDFVSRTAQLASSKVAVVTPADRMNRNASNSLLKNLEEPPGASFLLLLTAAPMRLSATVRSRCQSVQLTLPDRAQALSWLAEQVGSPAEELLDAASGRPLAAIELHATGGAEQATVLQEGLLSFMRGEKTLAECVAASKEMDPVDVLVHMQNWLQDLARWQACADRSRLRQQSSLHWCRSLERSARPMQVQQALQATLEANRMVLSTANPNWQLLLEDLLIRWRQTFQG